MAIASARASRIAVRVTPGQEWRVSLALLVLVMVGCFGLHVLLAGLDWWFELLFLSGLVIGSTALVRALTRRPWLPPVVSGLLLIATVTLFFAPGTGVLGIIPTPGTWTRLSFLWSIGNDSIARQSIPANADAGIMFLLCIGVGAITFVADLVATTCRAPALASIPVLVLLVVPSLTTVRVTDAIVFVLAGCAYLWLLRAGRPGGQTGITVLLSAVAVIGALLIPLVLPQPGPAQQFGGGTGVSTGVNPVVSLGQNLRQAAASPVLSYSTKSGDPHYLRLVTLENFTGANWAPDKATVDKRNTLSSIGQPPGLSSEVETKKDVTSVDVASLLSPWLPLPYPTSSVAGAGSDWYWDSTALSVSSPDETASGLSYQATSLVLTPTPQQLSDAGTVVPASLNKFLALPAKVPPIISQTAVSVAGSAASNYEKALALQDYFRNGDFVYSETAPVNDGFDGTGMQVIAKFLNAKKGYCIHFASAMAVMARTLGIPSRIAVGFLPGTDTGSRQNGKAVYSVTSHDLHAWPELYFDGIGWVPFEPTPGRGIVPSYADTSVAGVPIPSAPSTIAPSQGPTTAPSQDPTQNQQGQSLSGGIGGASGGDVALIWLWILLAVLVIILLGLLPAVARAMRRSSRLRRIAEGIAGAGIAWEEILQTADDLGDTLTDTTTPRQSATTIDELTEDSPEATQSLKRIVAAVEAESFARPGSVVVRVEVQDVRVVLASLQAGAATRARVRALLVPPSVWRRLLGFFSRSR